MLKGLTLALLLLLSLNSYSQTETADSVSGSDNSPTFLKQFLDVDFIRAVVQARRLSSVGTTFSGNNALKDSISGIRNQIQTDLFVRSYIDTSHLWAKVFNRSDYQRKNQAIRQKYDTAYIDFDMVFKSAGDKVFSVAINNSPRDEALFSTENSDTLNQILNSTLSGQQYTWPKEAPVNESMFNGMGYLLKKMGVDSVSLGLNVPAIVRFSKHAEQIYGFDWDHNKGMEQLYESCKYAGHNYSYTYKSVATNKKDVVKFEIEKLHDDFDIEQLNFVDANGNKLKYDIQGDNYHLTVEAGIPDEMEIIKAQVSREDQNGTIVNTEVGKLNLYTFNEESFPVTIVPVGTWACPLSASNIEDSLNVIFGQAAVNYTVTLADPFDLDKSIWDINGDDLLEFGTSSDLSCYTKEQKRLIRHYKDMVGVDDDQNYIFLMGDSSRERLLGFNPLKKGYGFLFMDRIDGANFSRTLAHELSHGKFLLEHNWKWYPMASEGSTDNLLDYSTEPTATHLHRDQWDLIHDPQKMIFAFLQDDEDGASSDLPFGENWTLNEETGDVLLIVPTTGDAVNVNGISISKYKFDSQKKIDGLVKIATHYLLENSLTVSLYNNSVSVISYDNYRITLTSNWDIGARPLEFEGEGALMFAYSKLQYNITFKRIVLSVVDGTISSKLESKWDFINGFVHEGMHILQRLDLYDYATYMVYHELEAYEAQMKHSTWTMVSSSYKMLILDNVFNVYMPMLFLGVENADIKKVYDEYLIFFNANK